MTTEPIDLDAGRALADAATPGRWKFVEHLHVVMTETGDLVEGIPNAKYIAWFGTHGQAIIAELQEARDQLDIMGDDQPRKLAAVKKLLASGTRLVQIERDDARKRAEVAEAKLAKVEGYADKVEKVDSLVDPCCVADELRDILVGGE